MVGAGEPARPAECPAVADHPHLACPDTARPPNLPAQLIYRRTKILRTVQLLLGHTKLEDTARNFRIEVGDSLEMAEQTKV